MFRIFRKNNDQYLLDIKDGIILYTSILRIDVLDKNENIFYLFKESRGVVVNEIIWGIDLEENYSKESNAEIFIAYIESNMIINMITETELETLLPISVIGDYEEPF